MGRNRSYEFGWHPDKPFPGGTPKEGIAGPFSDGPQTSPEVVEAIWRDVTGEAFETEGNAYALAKLRAHARGPLRRALVAHVRQVDTPSLRSWARVLDSYEVAVRENGRETARGD